MNCQTFSCGFNSGHLAGSGINVMLGGTIRLAEMPTGLIEQKGRVCARRDLRGDFGQVEVHRLGVASRHDERGCLAVPGTDRAEDIGRGGSLVLGRARTGAALGPTPGDLVLLADARLVREPYFYGAGIDALLARDFVRRPGDFFKILDGAGGLRVMARASRELAVAHGAQLAAQRLFGDDDRVPPTPCRDRRSASARRRERQGSDRFR